MEVKVLRQVAACFRTWSGTKGHFTVAKFSRSFSVLTNE